MQEEDGVNKHAIQQILAGDYWVHWTDTEEEWRHFTVHAWRAGRRNIPIVLGCKSLLSGLLLVIRPRRVRGQHAHGKLLG